MSAGHPLVAFAVAIARQDDLLHEAEANRIVAVAGPVPPRVAAGVRGWLGRALVDLGERLQSTHKRPLVGELAATAALRISR
jgi:hypothetical protein